MAGHVLIIRVNVIATRQERTVRMYGAKTSLATTEESVWTVYVSVRVDILGRAATRQRVVRCHARKTLLVLEENVFANLGTAVRSATKVTQSFRNAIFTMTLARYHFSASRVFACARPVSILLVCAVPVCLGSRARIVLRAV